MKLGRGRTSPAADAARPAPSPSKSAVGTLDLTIEPKGHRLGERLVAGHRVKREQLVAALTEAHATPGRRVGRLLVAAGAVDESTLARAVAEQHGFDVVDLRDEAPDPAAADLLPEALARQLVAIALSTSDDEVTVAVADPSPAVLDRLATAVGRKVKARVAAQPDILSAIGATYRALAGVGAQIKAFEARDVIRRDAAPADTVVASDDAPVVQVVNLIITQARRDRASDIHIEPHDDRIRVRYRIDGALHDVLDLPGSIGPALVSRLKILAGMNIVERRRPQDGQISLTVEDRAVDIRVSTTAVVGGEKVVLRLLDKSRPLFRLEQLGMRGDLTEQYRSLLRSPYGMVICAGPTGSGKTTTLYGSLTELNSPERNIMTIEDPVEYTFASINQIQINEAAGITFAGGLRSILRQDPDVILVGEIRDVETARIAVQSALTGHFVLSSLHATDATLALHRLLDMGIEHFLVASSVTAVLAQRLLRRICIRCKETYQPPAEELAVLESFEEEPPPDGFVRGAGCNFCAHTGYLDRIGVYELMPVSDTLRELILARAPHDEMRKAAQAEGLRTLPAEAVHLVKNGVTTIAEVLRSIYVVGA